MAEAPTLHLLIGPVGSGKTTYGQRRAAREPAVFLDLDAWMVRLYGGDARPERDVLSWYLERRERCRAVLWDVALDVLRAGSGVLLEIGLLGRAEREDFYAKVHAADVALVVHLVDAPRDARRRRVERRNQTAGPHTQVVPMDFFERASDAWEPPPVEEREAWGIVDASSEVS